MKKTALCVMMACLSLCFYPYHLSAADVATDKTINTEAAIDPAMGKTITITPEEMRDVEKNPGHLKQLIKKNHATTKKGGPVLIISGAGLLLIIILLLILL